MMRPDIRSYFAGDSAQTRNFFQAGSEKSGFQRPAISGQQKRRTSAINGRRGFVNRLKLLVMLIGWGTGIFVGSTAQSQTRFDGIIYSTPLCYDHSEYKENGLVNGVYGFFGHGLKHSFEAALDYTTINFATDFTVKQWDATLAYTYYHGLNQTYRAGVHYINTNSDWTNHAVTFLAGLNRYSYAKWNAGLSVYATRYSNYDPDFTALQITPAVGFYFGKGRLYSETSASWIHLTEEVGINLDTQNFLSVEQELSYFWKKFTFNAWGWGGRQAFAVHNDGFVVFNVAEKHLGGWRVSSTYQLTPKMNFTLGFQAAYFSDIPINNKVTAKKWQFTLGRTF